MALRDDLIARLCLARPGSALHIDAVTATIVESDRGVTFEYGNLSGTCEKLQRKPS